MFQAMKAHQNLHTVYPGYQGVPAWRRSMQLPDTGSWPVGRRRSRRQHSQVEPIGLTCNSRGRFNENLNSNRICNLFSNSKVFFSSGYLFHRRFTVPVAVKCERIVLDKRDSQPARVSKLSHSSDSRCSKLIFSIRGG